MYMYTYCPSSNRNAYMVLPGVFRFSNNIDTTQPLADTYMR